MTTPKAVLLYLVELGMGTILALLISWVAVGVGGGFLALVYLLLFSWWLYPLPDLMEIGPNIPFFIPPVLLLFGPTRRMVRAIGKEALESVLQ